MVTFSLNTEFLLCIIRYFLYPESSFVYHLPPSLVREDGSLVSATALAAVSTAELGIIVGT